MEQNLKKIFIGPSRKYACNGISFLDHLRNTLFIIICFLVILKLSTNARGRKTKMKSDNFWHVSNEKFANLDVKHRDVCTSRLITRRWCGERSRTKRMMRRRKSSRKRRFTRKHAYYIVRFPRVDRTDMFFKEHTGRLKCRLISRRRRRHCCLYSLRSRRIRFFDTEQHDIIIQS